ncbi:tail assembly protein [Pseudomonas frederiksbergensis]|uniref:tail assembly protein n=1 Tax=Pseudomonas frederiksbergensis TaxID=104087 RepID=UPI00285CDBE9|nr:tail assembly protein [Pseudomonas frederiksbergensis]MDR7109183.1 putative phage tail protein [Pseudomonas frederiksbergensis]
MTTILLSGSLAQAFGRKHIRLLETGTMVEAFSALKHTLTGFENFIRDSARLGLRFAIFRNRENIGESEFTLSGTTEIRIVPVIAGSKNGGLFQTIIGAVLIVVGAVMTVMSGGTASPLAAGLIATGIGMAAGGIIQMLTPVPSSKVGSQQEQASTENRPSYLFNGAFNSTQQGLPVPVVYGQMLVGSSVITVGTWTEALPV